MQVVGIVGSSGTGKTALAELLIPRLQHVGLRVGYIKSTHDGFDRASPSKDSSRIVRAGARLVGLRSPEGFLIESSGDVGSEGLVALMHGCDVVLVEGASCAPWPKVLVVSEHVDGRNVAPPILATLRSDPPGSFREEGITDLLNKLMPTDGSVEPRVELVVDGHEVPLGRFPSQALAGMLLGAVSVLDGVSEDARDVQMRIRRYPGR